MHCFGSTNCQGLSEQDLLLVCEKNKGRRPMTCLTQAGNAHSTTVQPTESQGTLASAQGVTVTTGGPPLGCSSTWIFPLCPCPSL